MEALLSDGNVLPGSPSGVKVIDLGGGIPCKMDAGSLKSGNGNSFASSPGLGGVYIVGGSGIVIVPGGSSELSPTALNPLSPHSSVSPSSTDVIIISGFAGAPHGVLVVPLLTAGACCCCCC